MKRALLLVSGLSVSMLGCVIQRQDRIVRDDAPSCTAPDASAPLVWVETDEQLNATPGEGAGVFVEYSSGGHWYVWTTCDTKITGNSCNFDVLARAMDASITNVVGDSVSAGGAAYQPCSNSAQLVTDVATSTAGVHFDTPPGARVQFDVLLDGSPYPELVYWYGSHRKGDASTVRYGAPGNPVTFSPTHP